MTNVMAVLLNIGGTSVQRRKVWLTPTTRCRAVTLPRREPVEICRGAPNNWTDLSH